MTRKAAAGEHLADLDGGLGAAAGHQMLVGGRAAAVAQVQVHQAVAHPAWPCRPRRCRPSRCATGPACSGRARRRADRRTARTPRYRAPACRRAYASARSTSARRRRTGRPGTGTCSPRPPSRRWTPPARPPAPKILPRSGAATETADAPPRSGRRAARRRARCDPASRWDWRPTPAARSAGTGRAPTTPGPSSAPRALDGVDVLADRFGPHHQLDAVVAEPGGVLEGGLGPQRIDRGRRQTDLDGGAHRGFLRA